MAGGVPVGQSGFEDRAPLVLTDEALVLRAWVGEGLGPEAAMNLALGSVLPTNFCS